MEQFLEEMKNVIEVSANRLIGLSDSEKREKKDSSNWSPIEILGHLVDSACNNHRRFILAQFKDDLIFDGYEQDKWTSSQNYYTEDWLSLVSLWKFYNFHIVHLCNQIPQNILELKRASHNLNEISWKKVNKNTPATLEYLITDYFGHLKHHIEQIFSMFDKDSTRV